MVHDCFYVANTGNGRYQLDRYGSFPNRHDWRLLWIQWSCMHRSFKLVIHHRNHTVKELARKIYCEATTELHKCELCIYCRYKLLALNLHDTIGGGELNIQNRGLYTALQIQSTIITRKHNI